MIRSRTPRPTVEALEDRWVPATVRLIGGTLYVSNPSVNLATGQTTLAVTQNATGQLVVTDGAANLGAYNATGLSLTGSGSKDLITVNLNRGGGGFSLGGNLSISSGNGNDSVSVLAGATGGRVGGNTFLDLGYGDDTAELRPSSVAGMDFGGDVRLLGGLGRDLVNVNFPSASSFPIRIGGDVSADGVNEFFLGYNITQSNNTVGGDVNVNFRPDTAPFQSAVTNGFGINSLFSNYANFSVATRIFGNVNVTGLSSSDYVLMDSFVDGNVNVSLGDGTNGLEMNRAAAFVNASQAVGGSVNYSGGAGTDYLLLDSALTPGAAGLTIGGSFTANTGGGKNLFAPDLANAVNVVPALSADVSVGGNFTLLSGGDATIQFNTKVSVSLSFQMGNGNDSVTVGSAPGGRLSWRSGNGTNELALTGAGFYDVDALFGSADDTFTLNNAAAQLRGRLDLGGRLLGNRFNVVAGSVVPPFQLSNVP